MSTILETRGLTHVYGAGTPFERVALDHVDIQINKGEILGVIGHTGSGKSTLIQHLNGLLQPSEGEVLLDGKSIWDAKGKCARETRFHVGLVFQYPEYQLFEETIAKDIAYGPTNMSLPQAEIDARVRESMEAVGLAPELADQSPFALSGGQKRRVAIAGVIAMRPDVLVLDEPTAGLDPAGRDEILSAITTRSPARPSSSSRTPWRIFRRSLIACSSWITQEFCSAIRRARCSLTPTKSLRQVSISR